MPLKKVLEFYGGHKAVIETVFWVAVFAAAYFGMIKVMHPG